MFTLHIEAHSIPELKRKALAAFGEDAQTELPLSGVSPAQADLPKPEAVEKVASLAGLDKKSVAKRTVKAVPALPVEEAAPVAPVVEEKNEPLTLDTCIGVLKQVIEKKGMDYAILFIKKFNVKKVSELKEAQFSEFFLAAKAELV